MGNVSFSALSQVYNNYHQTEGPGVDSRFKLWEERLNEAFFLYSLLEFSQRAGIQPEFRYCQLVIFTRCEVVYNFGGSYDTIIDSYENDTMLQQYLME